MKLQFDGNQEYLKRAVGAGVGLFKGQLLGRSDLSLRLVGNLTLAGELCWDFAGCAAVERVCWA